MNVTVLGAGAWGTALGLLLTENGHRISLWGHHPGRLAELQRHRRNDRYLPGLPLPDSWRFFSDLGPAVKGAEVTVVAVPSKAFREVVSLLNSTSELVVSVTKGIESSTGLTMSGILRQCLPQAHIAALSGPTLAMEVARGMPTAAVAASDQEPVAAKVQQLFHRPAFRVYSSTDILGVELGGALKNVIAIAAGVSDGLGFGDNSKAALVTRAIVEIQRLGVACGAKPETFAGLSGLGDLVVTCFSRLSRNRSLGERFAREGNLASILSNSVTVAEGYPTALSAHRLANRLKISTPIINEVYSMLYEEKNVKDALHDLLTRGLKPES